MGADTCGVVGVRGCLETTGGLHSHCRGVVGLARVDVEVGHAPIGSVVHVVVPRQGLGRAETNLAVHVQMGVGRGAQDVGVLSSELVDALLGTGDC